MLDLGTSPQTLAEANIILLLKHGKNPTDCASCRSISLLNGDVKILAMKLDTAMAEIISSDQTGFMRVRHSLSNIHRLIVNSSTSLETSEVVVFLDAEEAFDRVEWLYLFAVWGKLGFGPKFTSLYKY